MNRHEKSIFDGTVRPWYPVARFLASVLLVTGAIGVNCIAWAGEIWVKIDTNARTLYLMNGETKLQTFENISIGKNGATADKSVNDGKTPIGRYRVRWINDESRFHLFFGLDYPSPEQAANAYMADRITAGQLEAIFRSHEMGQEPSGSTPLGGAIGIHGVGGGDIRIHEDYDWTDGCVALTDQQVDELARSVGLGTVVVIE